MPPRVDPEQVKKEKEALKRVVLKSFSATPGTVKTLGTTTVAWKVTVPDTLFDITLELNGKQVDPTSSKKFSLSQTTPFTLNAVTENAGRQLRKLTVTVDGSECKQKLIPELFITEVIETNFDKRFGNSRKVKLKDGGTNAVLGDGVISIGVRLEIDVPNWFDADMSIEIQLAVAIGTPVAVAAKKVRVDVSWSFFEHLASLGCTGFVQSGMEQLAEVFMSDIVDNEIVPAVTDGFAEQVNTFVDDLHGADPQQRTYRVTSIVLATNGLTITACPQ